MIKFFLDTNILVYAYDRTELQRQEKALQLLDEALAGSGAISAQVLGEFYVTVTRKIPNPFDLPRAQEALELLANLHVMTIDATSVLAAIRQQAERRLSYWDSLIVVSAQRSGCEVLYTEDLNDGQRFGPVTVANPFRKEPLS